MVKKVLSQGEAERATRRVDALESQRLTFADARQSKKIKAAERSVLRVGIS